MQKMIVIAAAMTIMMGVVMAMTPLDAVKNTNKTMPITIDLKNVDASVFNMSAFANADIGEGHYSMEKSIEQGINDTSSIPESTSEWKDREPEEV